MLWRRFFTCTASKSGPLNGIKILDLTRVLAGPYCSMMLGDLGAEVIKVENPTMGDETRAWGPPFAPNVKDQEGLKESAYFLGVNRNKKSITINMKDPKGKEIIQKLVENSDVLIENYIPGKLDEMGLGYESLSKVNPKLIYASITGYGSDGPYSQRAGYDVVIEGEAGLMHITGEEGGNSVKVGVAITDLTTGLYCKSAILAALYSRQITGKGQKIDVSLIESQVASLANIASNYLIAGQEAKRMGTSHGAIVPYQSFKVKDGNIVVGAGNDRQYRNFCEAIKRTDLICPKFATNQLRVQNRKELIEEISNTLIFKTKKFWLDALSSSGLPHGPVNNIAETFSHPQIIHRKMIETVIHPTAGHIKLVGIPVKYSKTKPSIRLPPPLLGEHTNEILADLGYTDIEILKMKGRVI